MNKLSVSLMFIVLAACVACQRQQAKERKDSESQREMQERVAAEDQEQQQVSQREAKPNGQEKAREIVAQPDSSASPSTSPEKPFGFKSQAQKFQPRRTVPMTSPIRETPTPTPTP